MIEIQVDLSLPLFSKFEGMYIDYLHPDAWEWMRENVGPCDRHPDCTEWTGEAPDARPGHWDIIRKGFRVYARFHTEEHAVMFKLCWAENVIG